MLIVQYNTERPTFQIYVNITCIHNEPQVVMEETNFMQFAGTQARSLAVAD